MSNITRIKNTVYRINRQAPCLGWHTKVRVSGETRLVYRPGYFTVHPPPRLQVDQNFLTQKIVADPKMRCHQKSFGIWRVTKAILGQKTCFFLKHILEKIHNKSHYFFKFLDMHFIML